MLNQIPFLLLLLLLKSSVIAQPSLSISYFSGLKLVATFCQLRGVKLWFCRSILTLARVVQNLAFTSVRSILTAFESNIEPCRKGRLSDQQTLRRGCGVELYESQASLGTGSSLWPPVRSLLKRQLAFLVDYVPTNAYQTIYTQHEADNYCS
jgi:hypothetical protein